jgi:hypothetical protein
MKENQLFQVPEIKYVRCASAFSGLADLGQIWLQRASHRPELDILRAAVRSAADATCACAESEIRWEADGDNRVRGVAWSDVENEGLIPPSCALDVEDHLKGNPWV